MVGVTVRPFVLGSVVVLLGSGASRGDDCEGPCGDSSVTITWDAGVLDEAEYIEVCARTCEEVAPYTDSSKPGKVVATGVLSRAEYFEVTLSMTNEDGTDPRGVSSPNLERPRDKCGCRQLRFKVNDEGDALVME